MKQASALRRQSVQVTVTYRCLLQLGVQITLSPFHNRTIRSHECNAVLLEFWTVEQKSSANGKTIKSEKKFQFSHKLKETDHNGVTITSFLSRIFVTLSLFTGSKQFQIHARLTQNSLHITIYNSLYALYQG